MNRLSVVDEIFLRTHRGMGTPIALQGLWRTADRVPRELLERVHAALRIGPLGRRVVRSHVPGARPYWRANSSAHPLRLAERPLPAQDVLAWADNQGFDLDPEFGPGWRLAAAELTDGGSVVSLTCSHVLADGRGLAIAVDRALSGLDATTRQRPAGRARSSTEPAPAGTTPERAGTTPAPAGAAAGSAATTGSHGTTAPELGTPQSDWADARRQWALVLGGTARALRHGIPGRPARAPGRAIATTGGTGIAAPCAVLQIPAADWALAATARGGTANTLFLHLVAHMLWDSGFREPVISASLPVDTRSEPRVDNDMAMTEVTVTRADTPATLRDKCRAAYEHRMSSPGGLPEEILQVLPARAAHALSLGVAARAIHPGLTAPLPRTRLSAYLSRLADTYTLSLISLDPGHIESPTALTELARTVLDRADLPVTAW